MTSIANSGPPTRTRILVVEDDADSAASMAKLLELFGYQVQVARDGPQALDAACRWRPECVLLDLGLPAMDGFEVARRLRQLPGCRDSVLIAVTGYGRPEDRQRSSAVGIDHHLLKPVDSGALLSLLSRPASPPDAGGGSRGDPEAAVGGVASTASPA